MNLIKTEEEIDILKQNGLLVSKVLAEIGSWIKPGITTAKLDEIAEDYIRSYGAEPAFKGYMGYPNALCTSVNNQVVHGIPSDYCLENGDVISVDCGVKKFGYFGDSAYTYTVGDISDDVRKLLNVTKDSLFLGINQAIDGNRTGDISFSVQNHVESFGFSVVRELVGHGIGKNLHEPPEVPNYGKRGNGTKLKSGMVICIEPMINMGRKEVLQEKDGWTIKTADKKTSAHFELTVVVREKQAEILSTFSFIEDKFKDI